MASAYKPSPLSFGSPRSPFRRPETPTSPSTVRATTPQTSPTRQNKLVSPVPSPSPGPGRSWTPRGLDSPSQQEIVPSSTRGVNGRSNGVPRIERLNTDGRDALSKLPPAQVREMKEAFQTLDRDSDGQIGRDDVTDMLASLGQDTNTASYFPPGAPQNMALPTFLTTISNMLAPLSAPPELISAFAAFDEDDSGQVDIADLRDALLHTAPEPGQRGHNMSERDIDRALSGFTARRAFGKSGISKKGDVFKYQEFVASLNGGVASGSNEQVDDRSS